MPKETTFIRHLRSAGQRLSSPRLAIFRILVRKSPLAVPQLGDLAASHGIDRATTYRTVALFRQLGIVRDIVAGGKRLVELSDDYESHHHHFWCRHCGKLIDFDSPHIEQSLRQLADDMGVTITSHHVEISGLCAACR
jgi:Fur family ferric uptake transcriptional regulator